MRTRVPDLRLILLVVVLLGLVSLASRPASATGAGDLSAPEWLAVPGDTVVQTLLLVLLVAALAATAINFWAMLPFPRGVRRGRPVSASITAYLYFAAAVCFLILMRQRLPRPGNIAGGSAGAPLGVGNSSGPLGSHAITWLSLLLAFVITATAAGFLVRWWRSAGGAAGRWAAPVPELRQRAAKAVDDSLDRLRAEADPRRAVIAAYARLEADLKAVGLPRRPAEAPLEYVARILSGLQVGSVALRRLTDLFEWAKFSHHAVDRSMKDDALTALLQVRADLSDAPA